PICGFLGQAGTRAFLAVPRGGDQARRIARGGDVPRAARGSRAASRACADHRSNPRLASLRRPDPLGPARMAGPLPRPEADLVSAASGGPGHRHRPARIDAPGIRRLALARILDSARIGDRFQAGSLSPRARRARAADGAAPGPQGTAPRCRRPAGDRRGRGQLMRRCARAFATGALLAFALGASPVLAQFDDPTMGPITDVPPDEKAGPLAVPGTIPPVSSGADLVPYRPDGAGTRKHWLDR